ncbi:MAG: patatin-like phospholipase family protein, partial [Patescibacteria group bacterium]
IGVIKTLIENGIDIGFIAGSSMGALVGGWYAATKDINSLENIFLDGKKNEILKISKILRQKNDNQLKNDLVDQILKDNFKDIKIEQCQIPFRAIATDIKNGDEIILKEGSLLGAVRASINLPIVFNPVSLGDKLLIDGSFSNPLPADVVKEMGADFIIAVDVSSKWIDFPLKQTGWWQVFSLVSNVLSAAEYQLAKPHIENADLILRPTVLNFGWFDFKMAFEIIRAGTKETRLNLKQIFNRAGYPEPSKTPFEKFMNFIFSQE